MSLRFDAHTYNPSQKKKRKKGNKKKKKNVSLFELLPCVTVPVCFMILCALCICIYTSTLYMYSYFFYLIHNAELFIFSVDINILYIMGLVPFICNFHLFKAVLRSCKTSVKLPSRVLSSGA